MTRANSKKVTRAHKALAEPSNSSPSPEVVPQAPAKKRIRVKCPDCPRFYSRHADMVRHKKRHLNGSEFKCTFCGHKSNTKDNYDTHVRKHTGERPYKCGMKVGPDGVTPIQECTERFRDGSSLHLHKRKYHGHISRTRMKTDQTPLEVVPEQINPSESTSTSTSKSTPDPKRDPMPESETKAKSKSVSEPRAKSGSKSKSVLKAKAKSESKPKSRSRSAPKPTSSPTSTPATAKAKAKRKGSAPRKRKAKKDATPTPTSLHTDSSSPPSMAASPTSTRASMDDPEDAIGVEALLFLRSQSPVDYVKAPANVVFTPTFPLQESSPPLVPANWYPED